MTKAEKLKLCVGCRDDFYNGKNPYGVKECWSLCSARVVECSRVGIWQPPPYDWHPEKTLNCHQPEGSVWLRKEDVRFRAPVLELEGGAQ